MNSDAVYNKILIYIFTVTGLRNIHFQFEDIFKYKNISVSVPFPTKRNVYIYAINVIDINDLFFPSPFLLLQFTFCILFVLVLYNVQVHIAIIQKINSFFSIPRMLICIAIIVLFRYLFIHFKLCLLFVCIAMLSIFNGLE